MIYAIGIALMIVVLCNINMRLSRAEYYIEKIKYHPTLHHASFQVAPNMPCEKCGGTLFNGCNDLTGFYHYFCAHCGYLKLVASESTVITKPSHDELWKLKKYY